MPDRRTGRSGPAVTAPVAIVGLGIMGSAMAGRLMTAGLDVVGYDVDPTRAQQMRTAGATIAGSVAAAARPVDVLITSLPSGAALLEVSVALAAAATRVVVLETSTLSVDTKLQARGLLAGAGATLLDCPLSGTGEQARHGDLVAYLSGDDEDAKARVAPVLAAIGRGQHDLGAFGNGTRVKLIANLLVAVHNAAAAEALLLAERAGLDVPAVLAAVADGAGNSRMLQIRGPLMASRSYKPATMRVDTFAKDLAIIAAMAEGLGAPTPLFDVTAALYLTALEQGRQAQDTSAVHAVLAGLDRPRPAVAADAPPG